MLLVAGSKGSAAESAGIKFNRDVRPILSDRCYLCHGPDSATREADLRLDSFEAATDWAITPGDADASEVLARISSADPDFRMPPPASSKPPLSEDEIALIARWIDEGAEYEPHWAYVPPERPTVPEVAASDVDGERWQANPIDRFVKARLDDEGLAPSPRADRRTLLRRASLDLVGLPPTHEQIAKFLADEEPGAWERAVDELLDSPHYGEHQARYWLDAARYADSSGYQYDPKRDQWAWRDWVIDAFNANMPFDQFTIEQLAGDLLPDATDAQRLATGFNRNHPITIEGGVIDEEYRTEYVMDRTVTTAAVWLGMTLGCARCHDHKFDPISQREFYQVFAFFNQVPERGNQGFDPRAQIPSPFQKRQLDVLAEQIGEAEAAYTQAKAHWAESLAEETRQAAQTAASWVKTPRPVTLVSEAGSELSVDEDGAIRLAGTGGDDIVTLELGFDSPVRMLRLNAAADADAKLREIEVEKAPADQPEAWVTVKLSVAEHDDAERGSASRAIDGQVDGRGGWEIEESAVGWFVPEEPIAYEQGGRLRITLRLAGEEKSADQEAGNQAGNQEADENRERSLWRFRASLVSAPAEVGNDVIVALLTDPAQRSTADAATIEDWVVQTSGPADLQERLARLRSLEADADRIEGEIPNTMIMASLDQPRQTFVLSRGEYDKPTDPVEPGTPAALPPLPDGAPANRLGLALWLTMPEHPLTARVTVNRFWQQLFGVGLVDTPEDFGLQGAPPSHPELLDWLATEFVAEGWDVKELLKLIVTSETYCQESRVTPESVAADPQNRLLAHGPRHRLDAEVIRDSALAVSGLMVPKLGGPAVYPYHPKGLWLEINNRPGFSQAYPQDTGDKLFRRSVYTYWKRTVTPPSMQVFDAPTREFCQVYRSRTNTPLQAFVMLHDPQFVEAARSLAERMLNEPGEKLEAQFSFGFEACTSRLPSADELALLAQIYHEQLARFTADPEAAEKLLSIGESPRDESIPAEQHAAMATVARLLLNLSEFVTKG